MVRASVTEYAASKFQARGLAFSQAEVEAFYSSRYRLEPLFQLQGEVGPYWAYQLSAK